MRRFLAVLTAAAAFLVAPARALEPRFTAAVPAGSVTSPDAQAPTLAQGQTSAAAATDWMLSGDGTAYTMEASGRATDAAGATLSLRCLNAQATTLGTAISRVSADAFRLRRVLLTADVQTVAAKNGATIWLRVDRDARQLMLDNGLDEPQVGDTGWTRRRLSLPVPAEATTLAFGVLLQPGGGTVSVRNLRLEPGPRFDATGSIAPAAQKVLDAAISIVKTNALRASSVTWPVVEPEIRAYAAGAEQPSDVYPAIRLLLSKLGDRHSSLMTPSGTSRFNAGGAENQPADVRSLNEVGYINVPAYGGGDPAAARAYATRVHDGLAKTMDSATCGWIVDLRANGGGNMWPMLAALKPLLGNGGVGSFGGPRGSGMQWIAGSGVDAAPPGVLSVLESAWVAVLTGPRTASSGEAVAIAFRGRAHTRSFGQPTGGLSTANSRFGLPDGSTILLTIAVDVDRTGRRYGDKVDPDELVEPGPAPGTNADDPTVGAAIKWLKQSSGCGK